MSRTVDISHGDARALIARAIDKAEEIGMRGAVAVIGATGALVSASRMDHGGAGGMARAKSKAWIAATQQIPSLEHLHRLGMIAAPMVAGFSACSPEAVFPGAGGMPIRTRDRAGDPSGGAAGAVIAGLAASGAGIGPFVGYPGSQPRQLIADGRPANGRICSSTTRSGSPTKVSTAMTSGAGSPPTARSRASSIRGPAPGWRRPPQRSTSSSIGGRWRSPAG